MGRVRVRSIGLAAIPFAALTICVPFVNRIEPRVLGIPFLLFWLAMWSLATPIFMWWVGRTEHRW